VPPLAQVLGVGKCALATCVAKYKRGLYGYVKKNYKLYSNKKIRGFTFSNNNSYDINSNPISLPFISSQRKNNYRYYLFSFTNYFNRVDTCIYMGGCIITKC
jgi:hypothetical protein